MYINCVYEREYAYPFVKHKKHNIKIYWFNWDMVILDFKPLLDSLSSIYISFASVCTTEDFRFPVVSLQHILMLSSME